MPNAFDTEDHTTVEDTEYVERATVVEAPDNLGVNPIFHMVKVNPYGERGVQPALIPVAMRGDAHIPTVGASVLVVYWRGFMPLVLGEWYPTDKSPPPEYEAGERRWGHPLTDAYMKLLKDGGWELANQNGDTNITVEENGNVVIANDSQATVTLAPDDTVTVDNGTATLTMDGDTVTVDAADINLGGTSGSRVARKGDAVEVSDPDSGTLTGTITEGSSVTESE